MQCQSRVLGKPPPRSVPWLLNGTMHHSSQWVSLQLMAQISLATCSLPSVHQPQCPANCFCPQGKEDSNPRVYPLPVTRPAHFLNPPIQLSPLPCEQALFPIPFPILEDERKTQRCEVTCTRIAPCLLIAGVRVVNCSRSG